MTRKSGRPITPTESKQAIIQATVRLIKRDGAEVVTVRNVCKEAQVSNGTFYYHFKNKDDLLMYFLKETSFDSFKLTTPIADIANRIVELYMLLIDRYMELGLDFMKSFYSTNNKSLSAYMGEVDGKFEPDTVMARSEREMNQALEQRVIKDMDTHLICMDLCTIVKGCVFEWCLTNGAMDIQAALKRIINNYMEKYLAKL